MIEVDGTTGTESGVRSLTGTHDEVNAQIREAAGPQDAPARQTVEPTPTELLDPAVTVDTSGGPAETPPVEPPVPDTEDDSDADADAEATTAAAQAPRTSRSQRYRDNISALRRQLDDSNALVRSMADRFLGAQAGPQADASPAPVPAPAPSAPLTEDQFFEQHPDAPYGAYTQYVVEQSVTAAVQTAQRQWEAREAARTREAAFAAQQTAWNAGVKEQLQADPLFRAALDPEALPDIPVALVHEIITSAQGPGLYRHLVLHPEDAERLGALVTADGVPTKAMMRELGRLEYLVEQQAARPSAGPSRTTSRAPRPLDPIPGDASAVQSADVRRLPADSDGDTFARFEKGYAAVRQRRAAGGHW